MFGGWTAAVALKAAMLGTDTRLTPSAVTINFIDKVAPGADLVIRTRYFGGSRSINHCQAEVMAADDRQLAQAMVVLTSRRPSDGHTEPAMPKVPEPETLPLMELPDPAGQRTDSRGISGYPPFGRHVTSSLSWVRETSGRPVDHLQVTYLADASAPRCFFWSDGPRPSATLTLTVYFLASPEELAAVGDDYILNEAIGTRGAASTSGAQARLWSRNGVLLATTEQLAWFR